VRSIISDPKRKLCAAALAFVVLSTAGLTFAAPPQDAEVVAAFEEGRRLMARGDYQGAIAQFEKILEKTRAVGALLNLAESHAKLGHTATAWTLYRQAVAAAAESNDTERKAVAEQLAVGLEPRLSYLTIRIAAPPDGLTIRRDGVEVPREQWARSPVDPGSHRIEASAPGRVPWSGPVYVTGADTAIEVPALAPDAPAPSAAPTRPTEEASDGSTQRTIAIAAGGVGVAGVVLGAVAGLVAMSNHDDAKSRCTSYPDHCSFDGSAVGPNDDARTWATVSTIGFGVGAVSLIAGAALWLTAPRPQPRALRVVPSASPHAVGVGIGASF
jgi:hypothetical protein